MDECGATPAPTPMLTNAPGANSTIPCVTALWTQEGIAELTSEGTLANFGYPSAGTTLTDSKRQLITNMDAVINEGFLACFGEGSEWGEEVGKKCTGRHHLSPRGKTLLECRDDANRGMFPFFQYQARTGNCRTLSECASSWYDEGWNFYAKQWTPWPCATPRKKCTGKFRHWFLVHSQYQCQKKAEEANAPYYSFKDGLIKKCAISTRCKWVNTLLGLFTVYAKEGPCYGR